MSDFQNPNFELSRPPFTGEAEDNQLIDLNEVYVDTQQGQALAMVQGAESIGLGKLSRSLAIQMGLPNARQMDPFPSERNAVMGAESFVTTLVEGFKKGIENVIKYIRMALSWVVDTVKGIFGFKKSPRINKAINDSFENLREEFRVVLKGLGFPAAEYNLESFIGKFPDATDRLGQLIIMRSKFETDEESIKHLSAGLPMFQQVIGKLTEASNKVSRARDNLSRTIREEYNKTRARKHLGEHLQAAESPEVNRIQKACSEVLVTLDIENLRNEISKLLQSMYKIEFKNDALGDGFNRLRTQLDEEIANHAVQVGQVPVAAILTNIQYLNSQYADLSDNSMDMSRINIRALGDVIDKDDASKVQDIGQYYGSKGAVEAYTAVAQSTRAFSDFCQLTSRQLLRTHHQITHLVNWYNRTHLWYYHGLLDNFDKLIEINQAARAEGHNPVADAQGNPTYAMDFIPEADVKTFMEKFSLTANTVIVNDIADLKKRYNNLVKQTGVGRTI